LLTIHLRDQKAALEHLQCVDQVGMQFVNGPGQSIGSRQAAVDVLAQESPVENAGQARPAQALGQNAAVRATRPAEEGVLQREIAQLGVHLHPLLVRYRDQVYLPALPAQLVDPARRVDTV
jgi:hypothetical protein